jgi:ATP-dependent protease Clp ATPase subunit
VFLCRKRVERPGKLVAGPGVYICNQCVELCNQALAVDGPPPFLDDLSDRPDDELIDIMVRIHSSHANVDKTVQRVVRELRRRHVTWAKIGEALSMTRQSAWERFSGED